MVVSVVACVAAPLAQAAGVGAEAVMDDAQRLQQLRNMGMFASESVARSLGIGSKDFRSTMDQLRNRARLVYEARLRRN